MYQVLNYQTVFSTIVFSTGFFVIIKFCNNIIIKFSCYVTCIHMYIGTTLYLEVYIYACYFVAKFTIRYLANYTANNAIP